MHSGSNIPSDSFVLKGSTCIDQPQNSEKPKSSTITLFQIRALLSAIFSQLIVGSIFNYTTMVQYITEHFILIGDTNPFINDKFL